ncbi:glycosyltransferase family 4 protein [Pseudomonas sp. P7759]|nr:glycosyltransferase family 4 protein [Pseudomonas sp. P7759]NWC73108.1 glycosyltransferase family 4 protein [Pseudomonas sp. P7759]
MPVIRRVLLLSFYYPPDLAAGSFRVEALVKALLAHGSSELQIDVLTTQPNRYHSYNTQADIFQESARLTIRRIPLPIHKSGIADQARAFATYARGVSNAVKGQDYDLIVASSSRLMTAALAAAIAFRTRTPLYLDIRDIFVDTLPELFPSRFGRAGTLLFSWVERFTIRQASRVNLISPGFEDYFFERYPNLTFSTYTNGVDDLFLQPLVNQEKTATSAARLKIVYAGNIGAGQGLEHILPTLALKLSHTAQFYVIGDGGSAGKLRSALAAQNVTNVELIAPTRRSNLIEFYRQADILFLHLNTFKSFRRVLPSKLFEYAATGKPILAGLAGYAKQFTKAKIANACVFEPGDTDSALQALERLSLASINRDSFKENYSRTLIQRNMALDVLSTPLVVKTPGRLLQRYVTIKRWAFLRLDWFISPCRYPVAAELMAASLWG